MGPLRQPCSASGRTLQAVLFDAIFLTLFFLTWLLLGLLPWLAWSVRRRAFGAIWALPFALLGGAGGGVLVPLAGLQSGVGVGVSMITALAGGALLCAAAFRVWDLYGLGARFVRWQVRGAPAAAANAGGPSPQPIDSGRQPRARREGGKPEGQHDGDAHEPAPGPHAARGPGRSRDR